MTPVSEDPHQHQYQHQHQNIERDIEGNTGLGLDVKNAKKNDEKNTEAQA